MAARAGDGEAVLNELSLEGYLLGRYLAATLERLDGELTRAAFMAQVMPPDPVLVDDWTVAFASGSNAGSTYVRLTDFGPGDGP